MKVWGWVSYDFDNLSLTSVDQSTMGICGCGKSLPAHWAQNI